MFGLRSLPCTFWLWSFLCGSLGALKKQERDSRATGEVKLFWGSRSILQNLQPKHKEPPGSFGGNAAAAAFFCQAGLGGFVHSVLWGNGGIIADGVWFGGI